MLKNNFINGNKFYSFDRSRTNGSIKYQGKTKMMKNKFQGNNFTYRVEYEKATHKIIQEPDRENGTVE